jgi:anti-sigma regulatory factor (Ser/Thr protein kinase)
MPARVRIRCDGVDTDACAGFLRRNAFETEGADERAPVIMLLDGPDEERLARALQMPNLACVEIVAGAPAPIEPTVAAAGMPILLLSLTSATSYRMPVSHLFAKAVAARADLDAETAETLETVLQEAIINSLVHGNLEVSSEGRQTLAGWEDVDREIAKRLAMPKYNLRRLRLLATWQGDSVDVCVCDEGGGFAVAEVPAAEETAVSGRGLDIMRRLAQTMMHNQRGDCVTLTISR